MWKWNLVGLHLHRSEQTWTLELCVSKEQLWRLFQLTDWKIRQKFASGCLCCTTLARLQIEVGGTSRRPVSVHAQMEMLEMRVSGFKLAAHAHVLSGMAA